MFGGVPFAGAPFAAQGFGLITATVSATLTTSATITGSIRLSASVVSTLAFVGVIDGTLEEFRPRSYIVIATRSKYSVTTTIRSKYTVSVDIRPKFTITITEIPPMSHDIGDITEVVFEIRRTSDNALATPTALVVTVRTPSGTETSYTYGTSSELTLVSTGIYMLSYTPTESGIHNGRIQATGAAVAAEPFDFRVNNQRVGV